MLCFEAAAALSLEMHDNVGVTLSCMKLLPAVIVATLANILQGMWGGRGSIAAIFVCWLVGWLVVVCRKHKFRLKIETLLMLRITSAK